MCNHDPLNLLARPHQTTASSLLCRQFRICSASQIDLQRIAVCVHRPQNLVCVATDRRVAAQSPQASSTQQQRDPAESQPASPRSTHSAVVQSVPAGVFPAAEATSSPRDAIPPQPVMRTESVVDSTNSPSAMSTMSGSPYFVGNTISTVDSTDQRNAHLHEIKRSSVPSQPHGSPYANSRYTSSPYADSSSTMPAPTYYSPQPGTYSIPQGLYQQRPLPSNFPPAPPEAQVQSSIALPTSNPWEHHHYISPSSSATFPQSQDRYICTTCNKAFSRPSSLKIHSHSHTGEKPFRCPHNGCGKAFSVRSNMKRHERGCHSGMTGHVAHAHMI